MTPRSTGSMIYRLYRALTIGLTPLIKLHLRLRIIRGLEHPNRWTERLISSSIPRPHGPLVWFHAVSLGEGIAAIPVIKECLKRRKDINILMTTTTLSSFNVLKDQLPIGVLHQFSPVDTPDAINAFLNHWNPSAIIIIENELWPNLIMISSRKGIKLTLLNARVSSRSFKLWSSAVLFPLVSLMLSKFTLIVPLSNKQGMLLQLLEASPYNVNFAGDLKYVVEYKPPNGFRRRMENFQFLLENKMVWLASSIHKNEEGGSGLAVIIEVHNMLLHRYPKLVTIIVPRYPQNAPKVAQELEKYGWNVALASHNETSTNNINAYVVDTLGELRNLYKLSPIAVIGGSLCNGSNGHNISEAAAAGCAVITGEHVGHFAHMAKEMQEINPLAVLKVGGKMELRDAIARLLDDPNELQLRRLAAKQSFDALSCNIITNVWKVLNFRIFSHISPEF